jgi:hypothetical protein
MTINDLGPLSQQYALFILLYFLIPPLLVFGLGRLHKNRFAGAKPPYSYLYATGLYMVSFPGIMAVSLTAYSLLIVRSDLRNAPILLYFVPIFSMGATWIFAKRQVDLDDIPGFDRFTAFMMLIALCFFIAFVLNRLFFGFFIFGRLGGLLVVAVAIFVLMRVSTNRLLR